MPLERTVVISIDSLMEIFKAYVGPEDLPVDAKPLKLQFKPGEGNRLAILAESEEWTGREAPLVVAFDLKRVYGIS